MRFRFCGDLDCPDWVLAEINTLSKMSSVKMKILCQVVAVALCGEDLDEEKAKKMVADAKLEGDAMQACVSVLGSILTSSTRFSVYPDVLGSELEQLGLPKEHSAALCRVYKEHGPAIRARLASQALRLSRLEDVTCHPPGQDKDTCVSLKVRDHINNATTTHSLRLTPDQMGLLLSEMKTAKKVMDSLGAEADQ